MVVIAEYLRQRLCSVQRINHCVNVDRHTRFRVQDDERGVVGGIECLLKSGKQFLALVRDVALLEHAKDFPNCIGEQVFINGAVNLNLSPTKGMTLPLISYGGSSMLAICLTLGLALALTRRRPGVYMPG